MKKLLLLFSFFASIQFTNAQFCTPDMMFQDSSAGVYPIPNEIVCNNQEFELTLTVVVSETIEFGGSTLNLDSIRVVDISGLPAGIEYECNPSSCLFVANTMGCALASGIPNDALGNYPLSIDVEVYANGLSFPIEASFPTPDDTNVYQLVLVGEGDPTCLQNGTNDWLASQLSFQTAPNPTADRTLVTLNSQISGDMQFTVTNFLGKEIFRNTVNVLEGENTFDYDASTLTNGMYFLSISKNNQTITQKLIKH